MDHPDPPTPHQVSARRRLIRGALTAPALMTVCSGSAFAAASNLRCLANAANATTPPSTWGSSSPDTFLRVRLYKVTTCPAARPGSSSNNFSADVDNQASNLTGVDAKLPGQPQTLAATAKSTGPVKTTTTGVCANPVETFYIKGSDLGTYARSGSMPTNLQYLQINASTYVTVGSPVSPPGTTPTVLSQGYVDQYVALRFNSSGEIVGIGPPGSAGQGGMVGQSCWTSTLLPGVLGR